MNSTLTLAQSESRPGVLTLTLGLLLLVVWFANIGYRTLAEPDEGRYAEIPREMLATGDWIIPHLNGFPYLEKPPLQYWATAVGYSLFGQSPAVARLWPAALGLLGILIVYLTGRVLWGARAGEYAALITASSPLYAVVGHINSLDIGLAFFLTAALAGFLMANRVAAQPGERRHWMWLCWLALGLGFLQKGLVSLVLPMIALSVYTLIWRDWAVWRRLQLAVGLLMVGVLVLPWVIAASLRNPYFFNFFFVHEHFERFTTTEHQRTQAWWYFGAILAAGVLPWLVQIGRSLIAEVRVPRLRGFRCEAFLLVWAASILVFFSLSGSKLAPYVVPAVPPLALLAGKWLSLRASARALWPSVIITVGVASSFLLLEPLVLHFVRPGAKLAAYLELSRWVAPAGLVALAGALVAAFAIHRRALRPAMVALGYSVCCLWLIAMSGSNVLDGLRAGGPGLAQEIRPYLGAKTPFYCVGMYSQTLPFELQRTCITVAYDGELEPRFGGDSANRIPSLDGFLARWQRDPTAVAIVHPSLWNDLAGRLPHARVVVRNSSAVVIVRPERQGLNTPAQAAS